MSIEKNKNIKEKCAWCKEDIEDDDIYTLGDGQRVCEACYEEDCDVCECCGEHYLTVDLEMRRSCDDDAICVCQYCIEDISMEDTYDSMRREQSDEAARNWNSL